MECNPGCPLCMLIYFLLHLLVINIVIGLPKKRLQLPKKRWNDGTKSYFSLEPRDQLQQKLKCSLLLSSEFTTKTNILFSKAIKASKASNLALTGLVPHTFAKKIETRFVY